jgi:butyryl-CoA dehydrogenase
MDYALTQEQLALQESFRKFCEKEIRPNADLLDRADHAEAEKILRKNFKKLAEIGYTGLFHEEKYGGTKKDLITQSVAQEELARACASTYLSIGGSIGLCGIPIALFGSEEQKKKYLPKLITTEMIGSFGLTEPEAGSDAISLKTTAVKKGNNWVLSGTKTFNTNGPFADISLVMARTGDPTQKGKNVSSFIVEKGTKGFSAGKPMEKMGYCGSQTSELILEECEIPGENLVGQENMGFIQAMKTLEYGRIGMAVVCLGVAMACMEESIKYAKERVQFGRPIGKFQMTGFKLADMKLLTDVSRLLIYKASWLKEIGDPAAATMACIAKLVASEASTQISSWAVQIHGGYGYIKEFPVERLYREAKLGEIGEGTSEIQRILIARDVLAKY